nr:acyl-CoA dehydrogenase family protein [Sphingomonas sp. Y57]
MREAAASDEPEAARRGLTVRHRAREARPMNLDLSDQQRLVRDAAERFFSAECPPDVVRAAGRDAFSADLWTKAVGVGFVAMRAPEAAGGADADLLEATLLCEQAGRRLAPIPLPDGLAAARLLGQVGGDLAMLDDAPLLLGAGAGRRVVASGGSLTIVASDGSVAPLASGPAALDHHAAALAERDLLSAAWLVGAAQEAVAMAAAYAAQRRQFGKPIGAFQAVAHPLANAATDLDAGRLLVWRAVWAIAAGRGDAGASIAMARWWAATAARRAVRSALRSFGGYGLSLESDIQLYFTAINRAALVDGDPEAMLAAVGDRLWTGAATVLPETRDPGIDFGFGVAAERFASEARRFFEAELTDELRGTAHHSTDGHDPGFHRKLAAAGLAYPDWPRRWGGAERSPYEVSALARVFEEYRWTRVPIGITNMGARMVMQFGSPELQKEVLPRLAEGAALSCLGFSEPDSGSDIYAARTRAVRDGDDWVIDGQKMFTTGAHIADYVLLLARTDPSKPKHRGLTIFFVPLALPGVSIRPVHTLQDERTNITFYDQVRVSDRYRLGPVDGGMTVMAAAMAIEHGGEGYHVLQHSLLDAALRWARAPGEGGAAPIDDRAVRARIARVAAHVELADLLCRRATWATATGQASRATGPMAKLFATESYMADTADLMALAAPASLDPATPALVEIEEKHRQAIGQTIYGGTSEIHRTIIAEQALGLPRAG